MVHNISLCSPRYSAFSTSVTENSLTIPHIATNSIDTIALEPNHILIRVDHFGFSANNVTYQALGEHPHFRYFEYHPAPESVDEKVSPRTHGLIPVWGFGTIEASTHPKLSVGERVYGYFAPTRYLVLPISPKDVNRFAAYVPRPHLPPDRRPYNQILRCATDPHYHQVHEELTMLYRPLFWTSFWFEDYLFSTLPGYCTSSAFTTLPQLQDKNVNILISSASSKTAFCLAYLIHTRTSNGQARETTRVVGLTSAKNLQFTRGLDLYSDVLPYNADFASYLDSAGDKWVYVDVAGNDALNGQLASHFTRAAGPRLLKAVSLGLTNLSPFSSEGTNKTWSTNSFASSTSPYPPTNRTIEFEQFFMPEWLSRRQRELPIQEIFNRQKKAWDALMRDCKPWITLERVRGATNVRKAYEEMIKGDVGPEKGLIWSMWDDTAEESTVKPKL